MRNLFVYCCVVLDENIILYQAFSPILLMGGKYGRRFLRRLILLLLFFWVRWYFSLLSNLLGFTLLLLSTLLWWRWSDDHLWVCALSVWLLYLYLPTYILTSPYLLYLSIYLSIPYKRSSWNDQSHLLSSWVFYSLFFRNDSVRLW